MADKREVPAWLLNDLMLINGTFHEKTVTGRPNPHSSAVLNVGDGPPAAVTIDLTKRVDWKAIKKRLADEGYDGF